MAVQQHVLNWLYSILTSVSLRLNELNDNALQTQDHAVSLYTDKKPLAGVPRCQQDLQRRVTGALLLSIAIAANRCAQYVLQPQILSRHDRVMLTTRAAFSNGTSALLLHLSGTIPAVFRGAAYRYPISLWVPHNYPREAPLVYVTPTETMMVRPGQHVDPQGQVYHPYLAGWAEFWDVRRQRKTTEEKRKKEKKEPKLICPSLFDRSPPLATF